MQSTVINGIDISKHEGLVRKAVEKHAPKWICHADSDDVAQIARMGLMHAAARFDPTRGYRFSTYAMKCMFGFIQNELEHAPLTPVPAQKKLAARGVKYPSITRSADIGDGDEGRDDLASLVGATTVTPLDEAESVDMRERIHKAMLNLTEQQRFILRARFGMGGREEESLTSIGKRYKVSRSRVQQIEQKALRRLASILSRKPRRKKAVTADVAPRVVRRPIHCEFKRTGTPMLPARQIPAAPPAPTPVAAPKAIPVLRWKHVSAARKRAATGAA